MGAFLKKERKNEMEYIVLFLDIVIVVFLLVILKNLKSKKNTDSDEAFDELSENLKEFRIEVGSANNQNFKQMSIQREEMQRSIVLLG